MESMRVSPNAMARHLTGWNSGSEPLHEQLTTAMRDLILAGGVPQGAMLPSRRELARVLAVSRTTVGTAYDVLRAEGWVHTRHGAGTKVRAVTERQGPAWHGDRLRTYAAQDSPLDLSSGALSASPLLERVLHSGWVDDLERTLALDRFVPRGLPSTLEAVAQYFNDTGLDTRAEQVLITNGSHHGLALVADCLIQPGDVVLVEDPTYRGALDVFGRHGATVIPLPTDRDGIDPLVLESTIKRRSARMLYVLPTAHNVTGVTWSQARRAQVADVVERTGIVVLEDGSTTDLHDGPHPGHLGQVIPDDQSITIGSLTKLFWAGIRVGWIRGPRAVLESALDSRVTMDLAGSIPSQVLAEAVLPVAKQARELRRSELAHSRRVAATLLSRYLPEWSFGIPDGGACLWVDTHLDTAALAARLQREHIVVIPGSSFSPADHWRTHLRLPLGRPATLEVALPAIARLLAKDHSM